MELISELTISQVCQQQLYVKVQEKEEVLILDGSSLLGISSFIINIMNNINNQFLKSVTVLVIAYLTIGIIVKYKKYEARGLEVIPNIDFWKELPSLFKVPFFSFAFILRKII